MRGVHGPWKGLDEQSISWSLQLHLMYHSCDLYVGSKVQFSAPHTHEYTRGPTISPTNAYPLDGRGTGFWCDATKLWSIDSSEYNMRATQVQQRKLVISDNIVDQWSSLNRSDEIITHLLGISRSGVVTMPFYQSGFDFIWGNNKGWCNLKR